MMPNIIVDASGTEQTGTIVTKTSSNLTVSGATVAVPAGYYASDTSKSVATATQATPSISVSSSGVITASATQSAGYVSSGTKSAKKQLSTKSATTYTPSTSNQTISSGYYLTGTQTIKGDSNLVASNIKSGVSIFGVSGSYSGSNGVVYLSEKYYNGGLDNAVSYELPCSGITTITNVVCINVTPNSTSFRMVNFDFASDIALVYGYDGSRTDFTGLNWFIENDVLTVYASGTYIISDTVRDIFYFIAGEA